MRRIIICAALATARGAGVPQTELPCPNSSTYPADASNWGGLLPGDLSQASIPSSYPYYLPETCFHGAAVYIGWTSTNSFVRSFAILYGVMQMNGEPKHGLWRWTLPGKPPDAPQMWWCEMGGVYNQSALSGHEDSAVQPQSGMDHVWKALRTSQKANAYGPMANAAGLPQVAVTAVRVHLNQEAGARNWVNTGTDSDPRAPPARAARAQPACAPPAHRLRTACAPPCSCVWFGARAR